MTNAHAQGNTSAKNADAFWKTFEDAKTRKDRKKMYTLGMAYVKRFGKASSDARIFEAMDAQAQYLEDTRKQKKAAKVWKRILVTYDKRSLKPGGVSAKYAAKAQYKLTEPAFQTWRKIKLRGNLKRQKKQLQKKIDGVNDLRQRYERVYTYKSMEWTLAAGCRTADLFAVFAKTLEESEIPFPAGSEEAKLYKKQLDDIAQPMWENASAKYEAISRKAKNTNTPVVCQATKKPAAKPTAPKTKPTTSSVKKTKKSVGNDKTSSKP